MQFLAGLFLLAYAAVHLAIWLPRFDPETRPFDARDSWILRRADLDEAQTRTAAVVLASVCAGVFVAAGLGFLSGASWSSEAAAGGAMLSLMLMALYFHPWLASAVVINLAILTLAG